MHSLTLNQVKSPCNGRNRDSKYPAVLLVVGLASFCCAQVDMPWQTVGLPGNVGDSSNVGMGAVAYQYSISKFEVTNDQYVAFLNAKASFTVGADSLGLYSPLMATGWWGGIDRSGTGTGADPYTYSAKPNLGNKPVCYVSWYDCARFVNWLNNGQVNGDTEDGTYTLLGGTAVPTNGSTISRNAGARVFLPNRDEWYKAAYFEPGASGNSYWTYATRSDTIPTLATATATGDIANPGPNVVN